MINSIFSNPTWDDPKNNKEERIKEINDNFDKAIDLVRNPSKYKEKEINWNDPWWAAAKRGLNKTRVAYGLDPEGRTMQNIINHEEINKRVKMREDNIKSLDQLGI